MQFVLALTQGARHYTAGTQSKFRMTAAQACIVCIVYGLCMALERLDGMVQSPFNHRHNINVDIRAHGATRWQQ